MDLFHPRLAPFAPFEKLLIDPPREGAVQIVKVLPEAGNAAWPRRIVYVSCDPATLVRDGDLLIAAGLVPVAARAIDLMPQTSHVEVVVSLTQTSD